MKNALLAALTAVGLYVSSAGPALSQAPIVHLPDRADMEPGIAVQLDALSSRIHRYIAQGRLSPVDVDQARRELHRIQGEFTDDRERNGGRLEVADRFELQSQIDRLRRSLTRERTDAPAATAGAAGAPH